MDSYALYEKGRERAFLQFLRQNKKGQELSIAAVMESCEDTLLDVIIQEQLCQRIVGHKAEQRDEYRFSLYPSISRTTLYHMSVGADADWLSWWMRMDFETGRKSIVMLDGLDPFTGKEPAAYRDMILGYIRKLIQMGVLFVKELEDVKKICGIVVPTGAAESLPDPGKETAASKPAQETRIYKPEFDGNLVQQKSLRRIPDQSIVQLPKGMVLTPLARDYIKEHQLRIIVE